MMTDNVPTAEVPERLGANRLRACLRCRLIKSISQWRSSTCDNCPSTQGLDYLNFTTPVFRGMVAMLQPQFSWVARWQKQSNKARGLYAMSVIGEMANDEIYENEDEERIHDDEAEHDDFIDNEITNYRQSKRNDRSKQQDEQTDHPSDAGGNEESDEELRAALGQADKDEDEEQEL